MPGFNDSGAHITNMAFFDANLSSLKLAKAEGLDTVATIVKRLTREPAQFFGLDVGTLELGALASPWRVESASLDIRASAATTALKQWLPEPLSQEGRVLAKTHLDGSAGALSFKDFDLSLEKPAFEHMAKELPLLRGYTDAFGHLLVLSGAADAMVDCELNPWDAAATQLLAVEAGGACETFTRARGKIDLVFGSPALVEDLEQDLGARGEEGRGWARCSSSCS